MPGTAQLI